MTCAPVLGAICPVWTANSSSAQFFRDLVREAMKDMDFVFHLAAMVSVQGDIAGICRAVTYDPM